ncbi:MAG: helix-turn-helix transcriptional regulator [Clostridiales bacterium]|jgi:transcriptional regulator with XRE-family HTH domain|nr:helix-turn-helix transcriptional regulator [Clostridiales bacterium]
MSRLGDLIHLERTRRNLTFRQVARVSGVSEKYLQEVEEGKRIIADVQAQRILKNMGIKETTQAEFSLDDIAATVDLQSAVPGVVQRAAATGKKRENDRDDAPGKVDGSIWLDALSNVLRRVPIYNAVMQEVGHRLLPVENGKIEGAKPEKVFYFMAPDNAMRGFRIHRGDKVLIVPQTHMQDGALMLLDSPFGKVLRMVKEMPRFQVMLQTYNEQFESEIQNIAETVFIGRAVRLEADL